MSWGSVWWRCHSFRMGRFVILWWTYDLVWGMNCSGFWMSGSADCFLACIFTNEKKICSASDQDELVQWSQVLWGNKKRDDRQTDRLSIIFVLSVNHTSFPSDEDLRQKQGRLSGFERLGQVLKRELPLIYVCAWIIYWTARYLLKSKKWPVW